MLASVRLPFIELITTDSEGGKCGATNVDRNLEQLMVDRYGTHYSSLPASKTGPGSPFMKSFEDIRNDFDGSNYSSSSLQLIMKRLEEGDSRCIQYDTEECQVILTALVGTMGAFTTRS